jgi:hypothetical protein
MSEQETIGEGPQKKPASQPHVSESDRDRPATKLTEDELTFIIKEVAMLCMMGDRVTVTSTTSTPEVAQKPEEDRVIILKSSLEHIEHRCREIERTLRTIDRHMRSRERERRQRIFRDRSPIYDRYYSPCSRNSRSDSYFDSYFS